MLFLIRPYRRFPVRWALTYRASFSEVVFLLSVLILVAPGCEGGSVRTISSGSHEPYSDAQWAKFETKQGEKLRFIVMGQPCRCHSRCS